MSVKFGLVRFGFSSLLCLVSKAYTHLFKMKTWCGIWICFFVGLLKPVSTFVVDRVNYASSKHQLPVSQDASPSSFDMGELNDRISAETKKAGSTTFLETLDVDDSEYMLYIIVFESSGGGPSGIHSVEYPKGSGLNTILAFESCEVCEKFCAQLKAKNFFNPSPQELPLPRLEELSNKLGVSLKVIPAGVDVIAPKEHVENLGLRKPTRPYLTKENPLPSLPQPLELPVSFHDKTQYVEALFLIPSGGIWKAEGAIVVPITENGGKTWA